jgi:hypothetical protein
MFATVETTATQSNNSFAFTIDKGSDDGIMPSSSAYGVLPGTGASLPYNVDITWVTKTSAGGYVKNVPNAEQTKNTLRKVGVEIAKCSAR